MLLKRNTEWKVKKGSSSCTDSAGRHCRARGPQRQFAQTNVNLTKGETRQGSLELFGLRRQCSFLWTSCRLYSLKLLQQKQEKRECQASCTDVLPLWYHYIHNYIFNRRVYGGIVVSTITLKDWLGAESVPTFLSKPWCNSGFWHFSTNLFFTFPQFPVLYTCLNY